MKQGSISPVRVILFAALLGTVGGVALSLHRQRVEERELEALEARSSDDAAPKDMVALEPPGKGPQTGTVHLTAVEGLPQYPHAFVRPLASAAKDGGAEMNIAWFSTRDSMDDVLNFYAHEFGDKHKRWVTHEFSPNAGYAAYLDLKDHRLHMVSVLVQPHETLVFASSSYPGRMFGAGGATQAPAALPVVDGAEGALTFDVSAGLGPQRQLWTSTFKQRTIADVRDAYRKALVEAGWKVEDGKVAGPSEARLDAKRGSGAMQVMIRRDAASSVAVYVSMSGA